ncbi:hypothetical protein E0Z10_g7926 [Xylaria hypoxylon]|uniref:Cytochrome P450 monooxygenase n=1 Tax=Xylaria hypoxylon TaxID=37992 RepID=A0A4Z0YCP9_9PEZI|nr:hypothetical protein E0Z10_g7926 [Xylaria hypoxylon]
MSSSSLPTGFYPVIDSQAKQFLLLFVAFLAVALAYSTWEYRARKLPPVINPPKLFDFTGRLSKDDFLQRSYAMVHGDSRGSSHRPYTVYSDVGPVILLSPRFADEIKNNPHLDFLKNIGNDFHSSIPGFQTFKADTTSRIVAQVAKKQLTKSLNKITKPLSKETAFSLHTILGDSLEWKEYNLPTVNLPLVARISSLVFLGERLCRDDDWLQITSQLPVDLFMAAYKLRMYPKFLRPLVHWFLPECQLIRRELAQANALIEPVIKQRQEEKRKALEEGLSVPTYDDAIDWAEEESKQVKYEPAKCQVALSVAAIHTTTDLLSQTILELLAHPELIQPLRDEVIEVLRIHGWTKAGLYNLKLMDSILKETQRTKPIQMIAMSRLADADIHLSDGTVIPKGGKCAIANTSRLDGDFYDDPQKFDGYRFLNMRSDPGKEQSAQFVTTGVHSLGFGHGTHACPGRFFAANEVKVALSHLILKYDLELAQGTKSEVTRHGFDLSFNREARIRVRRRKEELDIDSL